jgi:hypothetical protein
MLGTMPRARGSRGNTPQIREDEDENEVTRNVSRVEWLFKCLLEVGLAIWPANPVNRTKPTH